MPGRPPYTDPALKSRIATDYIQYDNPLKRLFFKFTPALLYNSKLIGTIPKGHVIQTGAIRIYELFNGSNVLLHIGTTEDVDSIAVLEIDHAGAYRFPWSGERSKFFAILKSDTNVRISITAGALNPTTGNGWGILEYLNLGGVPGYVA